VGKSDEYRRFAAECLKIGQAAEDEQQRAIFLQMARAWLALAQRDETVRIVIKVRRTRSSSLALGYSALSFCRKLRPQSVFIFLERGRRTSSFFYMEPSTQ
jgi:hypothetical protein